jgi:hypothetical protein
MAGASAMPGVGSAPLTADADSLLGNAAGVSVCAIACDDKPVSDILKPIQYKLSFNMNVSPFFS